MYSILLPVYRWNVEPLIRRLVHLIARNENKFEIICMDDASPDLDEEMVDYLNSVEDLRFLQAAVNLGRAAIRNELMRLAAYQNLIFLDCDLEIPGDDFLENYISNSQHEVVYGGRTSCPRPQEQSKLLHWKYGEKREVANVQKRQKQPYLSFMSSNFMIRKSLLEQIPFDESIAGYGHEDSKLAMDLKAAGVPITHIHNPVIHLGLYPSEIFLKKVKSSAEMLAQLHKRGTPIPSSLNRWGSMIADIPGATFLLRRSGLSSFLHRHLLSLRTDLLVLDILKMFWWLESYHSHKR